MHDVGCRKPIYQVSVSQNVCTYYVLVSPCVGGSIAPPSTVTRFKNFSHHPLLRNMETSVLILMRIVSRLTLYMYVHAREMSTYVDMYAHAREMSAYDQRNVNQKI